MEAGEGKGWDHCGILGIRAVIVHSHPTLRVVAHRAGGDGSFGVATFWCPSACLCCRWMVAPVIHPASRRGWALGHLGSWGAGVVVASLVVLGVACRSNITKPINEENIS
jgi:hypothetical protein